MPTPAYDLIIAEAEVPEQYRREGDPAVNYGAPELVPPGKAPDERLDEHTLATRPYVVYRGEGKVDEYGLPERFVRADRVEIEPGRIGGEPRKVRKRNKPKRPKPEATAP